MIPTLVEKKRERPEFFRPFSLLISANSCEDDARKIRFNPNSIT